MPALVTILLGMLLIGGFVLAVMARRNGWRLLGAVMATAGLIIMFFLMLPGAYLFRYWFMVERPVVSNDYTGETAPYAVTVANGWPIDFGENRLMTVLAPDGQDLVVNYGREGFSAEGQQIQVCGTAFIPAGYSLDLVFWAGNAEAVTPGGGADYAVFTYANRRDPINGDTRCQAWETYGGFTAVP